MSDDQTTSEIKWVPLVEAPFKLRFGWERLDNDEERPDGTRIFGYGLGWVYIYRTARGYFFIECRGIDDKVGAAFPIGDYAYLGADARLSPAETAAQGEIVNFRRTQGAIETALRLAVLEGQLGFRTRKSLDGPFTDIPPSAVPELKFTNWKKSWGEYTTGERLFDIRTSILNPNEAELDHTFSRRLLMTIDPGALRRIQPDYLTTSIAETQESLSAASEGMQVNDPQDSKTKNRKLKRPHRPPGHGYQKADEPLVDEMRSLLIQGRATSPTQAAARLVSRAVGKNTDDASKIRRLVGRYKERFPDAS